MTPEQRWEYHHGVCSRCNGYGHRGDEYVSHSCRHCGGTGKVPVVRWWRPAEPERRPDGGH